jgi:hypothetical protein
MFRLILENLSLRTQTHISIDHRNPEMAKEQMGDYEHRGAEGTIKSDMAEREKSRRCKTLLITTGARILHNSRAFSQGAKSIQFNITDGRMTCPRFTFAGKPSTRFLAKVFDDEVIPIPVNGRVISFARGRTIFRKVKEKKALQRSIRISMMYFTRWQKKIRLKSRMEHSFFKSAHRKQMEEGAPEKGIGLCEQNIEDEEDEDATPCLGKKEEDTATRPYESLLPKNLISTQLLDQRHHGVPTSKVAENLTNCTECGVLVEYSLMLMGPWRGLWCGYCPLPCGEAYMRRSCTGCDKLVYNSHCLEELGDFTERSGKEKGTKTGKERRWGSLKNKKLYTKRSTGNDYTVGDIILPIWDEITREWKEISLCVTCSSKKAFSSLWKINHLLSEEIIAEGLRNINYLTVLES